MEETQLKLAITYLKQYLAITISDVLIESVEKGKMDGVIEAINGRIFSEMQIHAKKELEKKLSLIKKNMNDVTDPIKVMERVKK